MISRKPYNISCTIKAQYDQIVYLSDEEAAILLNDNLPVDIEDYKNESKCAYAVLCDHVCVEDAYDFTYEDFEISPEE